MRRRAGKHVFALGLFALFAAFVAAIYLAPGSAARTPRMIAVERLLRASKAGDHAAFSALTMEGGVFMPYFDVASTIELGSIRDFIGDCKAAGFAEGPDTVAVAFDCSRDLMGRFFVDFTFCGDRVGRVTWPEEGRLQLSPALDDLWWRIDGTKQRDACRPVEYGLF